MSILDEPIPTAQQSVCSTVTRGVLFLVRFGGSPYEIAENLPEALLDILKLGNRLSIFIN